MRKFIFCSIIAAFVAVNSIASADEPAQKVNHVGAQLDFGAPDGAAFGVQIKPKWYWLATGLSATYNGFAPGIRGSLKLDPIKFPIRLTMTGELGHSFEADLSAIDGNIPKFSYTYANFHPGIELGSNNGFSFFIHMGPTWIDVRTTDFAAKLNTPGLTVDNPHGSAWVFPSAKFGFVYLFI